MTDLRLAHSIETLEQATRQLAAVNMITLPQLWPAAELEKHYGADWKTVKALWRRVLARELGNRQTARAHIDEVLRVDATLRSEIAGGGR